MNHTPEELPEVTCPICHGNAEKGCIYAPDGNAEMRWIEGEPSVKKKMLAFFAGGKSVGRTHIFMGAPSSGRRIILDKYV